MKRCLFLFLVFGLAAGALHGQSADLYTYTSDHYRVGTDISESYARRVADKMEAALVLFNDMLHFDLSQLSAQLKVTIFRNKAGFDEYLERTIDQSRENFVYIHYSDIRKSELVGFNKEDIRDFDTSLLHQGFIQLLKAFVPNPPIWFREGTATYLEQSIYDEDARAFEYRPNLLWLERIKSILSGRDESRRPIALSLLLTMDRDGLEEQLDVFYPQAWGMVTFLLETDDRRYGRIYWDALNTLDPEKSLRENSVAVMREVFSWYDESLMVKDFADYIMSIKTFNELVTEGVNSYTLEEYDEAADDFMRAVELEPQNHIPYYYLGLISYAKKDYSRAEGYYKAALALGAGEAVTTYALGVNAFADNRFDVATAYLLEAKELDPVKYGEKVDSLLQRMEALR